MHGQQLGGLLREGQVSLRLICRQRRPGQPSSPRVMDAKTVHPSDRDAVLAAYASLPGAALVTPALSYLLPGRPRSCPCLHSPRRDSAR
jgi:hypothetical protein